MFQRFVLRHRDAFACIGFASLLQATAAFGTPAVATNFGITTYDMVRTEDLSKLTVASDGSHLVALLQSPDPQLNRVKQTYLVFDMRGGNLVRRVDAGDEIWSADGQLHTAVVVWAPDSRSFFYRKLVGDEIQVWRSSVSRDEDTQVTHSKGNVRAFEISRDGREIYFSVGISRSDAAALDQAELRNGVVWDDKRLPGYPLARSFPVDGRMASVRMGALGPESLGAASPDQFFVQNVGAGSSRPATANEPHPKVRNPWEVDGPDERSTETPRTFMVTTPSRFGSKMGFAGGAEGRVGWAGADGKVHTCPSSFCAGIVAENYRPYIGAISAPRFSAERTVVTFVREPKIGEFELGIIEATTGRSRVAMRSHRMLSGDGRDLSACPVARGYAFCVASAADSPPMLVEIDLRRGSARTMYDPNAGLRGKQYGKVEYLTWTNGRGQKSDGVLVHPVSEEAGVKYPLVITTYVCTGFLRGGAGDDVPEHVLSTNGYFAFCVHDPERQNPTRRSDDVDPNAASFADSIRTGLRNVIDRNPIDQAKIGISGYSFGAETTYYMLWRWPMFAAATVSNTGSFSPVMQYFAGPKGWFWRSAISDAYNYPDYNQDVGGVWAKNSPALNASKMRTPLLMQLPETEYRWELHLYQNLLDHHVPTEMIVYSDEAHTMREPAHLLKRYDRNVDWFDYWILGRRDEDRAKIEQYQRWDKLRAQFNTSEPVGGLRP